MITPDWVRIPVRIRRLIPLGVGSAKVYPNGDTEVILPGVTVSGREWQEDFRNGNLDYLLITPVYKGDTDEDRRLRPE